MLSPYRKTETVQAECLKTAGAVATSFGNVTHEAGDFLVHGANGETWLVPRETFHRSYMPWIDTGGGMTFGEALVVLRRGGAVRRSGWNERLEWADREAVIVNEKTGERTPAHYIAFVGTIRERWKAPHEDLLASDWEVVP